MGFEICLYGRVRRMELKHNPRAPARRKSGPGWSGKRVRRVFFYPPPLRLSTPRSPGPLFYTLSLVVSFDDFASARIVPVGGVWHRLEIVSSASGIIYLRDSPGTPDREEKEP